MDLIPGGETETSHAVEKLSLRAATAETCMLWSLCATTRQPVCHSARSHMTR